MKNVLITQRLVRIHDINEIRNALDIRWQKLLLQMDLFPIPVPVNIDMKLYDRFEISGIILTGGNDLSSQSQNELSLIRDKHEMKCIDYALRRSIPIFGVCRGLQLIAEYFGSTFKKIDNHVAERHKLRVINESKYSKQIENIESVNSYHNYAIDIPGDELVVVAICPHDNVIEAITHKNHKIYAQMWHPEREKRLDVYNHQIISSLFHA
jgi:N5-(cytidine 5'-diphosphoramidyl)-L-glutamine hydrolase